MTVGKTFSSHGQAVTLDVFPVPPPGNIRRSSFSTGALA
jgi:hypothetical protein